MVQRITKAANKPTNGARIKIVSGPKKNQNEVQLTDPAFDPHAEGETRQVNNTTGYFGKTIAELSE